MHVALKRKPAITYPSRHLVPGKNKANNILFTKKLISEALLMHSHNMFSWRNKKIQVVFGCKKSALSGALIVLGFNNPSILWVILCRLPEKGRKYIEEIVEEMKERATEERGTGMKVNKQTK